MESPVNEKGGCLWSCNFAIKRQLFKQLGGFDEKFPAPAMEDIDLHHRLGLQGVQTVFVPRALVGHPWRIRKGLRHLRQIAKSIRYFTDKYPEKRQQFRTLSQLANMAKRLLRTIFTHPREGRFRGLLREIVLLCYSSLIVVYEVNIRR